MKGIAKNFSPTNKGIKIDVDGKEDWYTVKDDIFENFVKHKINKEDEILFSLVDDKLSYIKVVRAGESVEEPVEETNVEVTTDDKELEKIKLQIEALDVKLDKIAEALGV